MTDHIRGALLAPLWSIVSEYLQDVELSMMSSLAIMPAGKYHKDMKSISMPKELIIAYERADYMCVIMPISDMIKTMTPELTFIYEAALHGCINVIEWKFPQYTQWEENRLIALKAGAAISDNVETLERVQQYCTPDPNLYMEAWKYHDWGLKVARTAFLYRKNVSLRWLRDKIIDEGHDFGKLTILYDNFELLQWHWQLIGRNIDRDIAIKFLPIAVTYGSPRCSIGSSLPAATHLARMNVIDIGTDGQHLGGKFRTSNGYIKTDLQRGTLEEVASPVWETHVPSKSSNGLENATIDG